MPIIYEDANLQIVETITPNGRTVQTIHKPGSPGEIQKTIRGRAAAALTANQTYLAIGSPNNAQVVAQVNRLTRECSALIRLLLSQFDSTNDT